MQRASRPALSTWGEAILAAATGDSQKMAELLLERKHDDGRGVDLRTFRTSWDDMDFIWQARSIRIDAHYTLIELAVERDHFDVVMLLTADAPGQQPAEAPVAPPEVHRAISTFVAPAHADLLREATFATLTVRPADDALAGLPQLFLAHRQVFLLASEALALPLAARQAAIGSMTEDAYTQEGVDEAISWWAATVGGLLGAQPAESLSSALPPWGLHALYTSGDGNCLLHGALLGTVGVRDTRVPPPDAPGASTAEELAFGGGGLVQPRRSLRAALHHAVTRCAPLRALLASHGALLEPEAARGGETVESRSVAHGASCDPAHVLALAHIFRRPVVVYAAASVGEVRELDDGVAHATMSTYASSGARMSGVYLPCLLRPDECASRDPILLAYSQGHFSALCGGEASADERVWRAIGVPPPLDGTLAPLTPGLPVPLVDETLAPLPVLFPPTTGTGGTSAGGGDGGGSADAGAGAGAPPPPPTELELLRRYLDVSDTAPLGPPGAADEQRRSIRVALLRVPPPSAPLADRSAADAYYASLWARRVAAAEQRDAPGDPVAVMRAPSASRENSVNEATVRIVQGEEAAVNSVERERSWEVVDECHEWRAV